MRERGTRDRVAVNPRNAPLNSTFVTAMLKGRSGGWALELQGFFLFTAVALIFLGPGRYKLKN